MIKCTPPGRAPMIVRPPAPFAATAPCVYPVPLPQQSTLDCTCCVLLATEPVSQGTVHWMWPNLAVLLWEAMPCLLAVSAQHIACSRGIGTWCCLRDSNGSGLRVAQPVRLTAVRWCYDVLLMPQPLRCTRSRQSSSRRHGMSASLSHPITPDGSCATQSERCLPFPRL